MIPLFYFFFLSFLENVGLYSLFAMHTYHFMGLSIAAYDTEGEDNQTE